MKKLLILAVLVLTLACAHCPCRSQFEIERARYKHDMTMITFNEAMGKYNSQTADMLRDMHRRSWQMWLRAEGIK